jgi:hypothetical protein
MLGIVGAAAGREPFFQGGAGAHDFSISPLQRDGAALLDEDFGEVLGALRQGFHPARDSGDIQVHEGRIMRDARR